MRVVKKGIYVSVVALGFLCLIQVLANCGNGVGSNILVKESTYSNSFDVVYEKVTVDIFSPEEITLTEVFVIKNNSNSTIQTISFWENQTASTFIVSDNEGVLNFSWVPFSNSSHLILTNLRYPLEPNETTTLICSYNLLGSLPYNTNDGEIEYYSYEYQASVSFFTQKLEIRVILPEKTFLYENEENSVTSFYPQNATQTVHQNRILVQWSFQNVSVLSNPLIFLKFEPKILPPGEEPIFAFSFNVFIFGFVIGLFLGVSGTFWLIRYREKRAKGEISKSLLNENQIALIRLIYEHGGKLSQRELCDLTGFSKSKVSRNLIPLEKRGLIIREKWGRTYVVYLTENGKEVIEQ